MAAYDPFFGLRWELDNARARIAAGSGESEVFEEEGFEWKIRFNRNSDALEFTLICDHPGKGEWECQANIMSRFDCYKKKKTHVFSTENSDFLVNCVDMDYLTSRIDDDELTVELIVTITSQTTVATPNQFEAPNASSDVVLIVDGKKLHVNKGLLSVHSPVFCTMFNGDFVEKGKDEIEIKEVVYEEFVDLLSVIYPSRTPITDSSVEYILKLADQFHMKDTRDQAEKFLFESDTVKVEKKLILAEKYNIQKLMDHCLNSIKNNGEIIDSFTNFCNFSDDLKNRIWKRMNELRYVRY